MTRVFPDRDGLLRAASVLRAGGIVAYPTETVYGLGVSPALETALDALFKIKNREKRRPVLLVVADALQAESLVHDVSAAARRCMELFWPGPLSLVLPAATTMSPRIMDEEGNICIRCSSSPMVRELCRLHGGPITSTSANLSGQIPARTADEACLPGITLLVDGGPSGMQLPSTVYNPNTGGLLREGPITGKMLADAGLPLRT